MNTKTIKAAKRAVFTISSLFLLITLSSCLTTAPYHRTESQLLQSSEVNGIYVECLYLDQVALKTRHGAKSNPFLTPPGSMTPQPVIIFELKIVNKDSAPLKLDIRDVEFYYNDNRYIPLSKLDIEAKIDKIDGNSAEKMKQKRIARAFMLGDIKTIEGNSEAKGYMMFMANFKDRGKSELFLPFKTIDRLEAGELTFKYDFRLTK